MKSKDERKSMQRKRLGIEEESTPHTDSFKIERVDTFKDSDQSEKPSTEVRSMSSKTVTMKKISIKSKGRFYIASPSSIKKRLEQKSKEGTML